MFTAQFLSGERYAGKTFYRDGDGNLLKDAAPNIFLCSNHAVDIESLEDFYAAMKDHAARGHVLLKGPLRNDLQDESRANQTPSEEVSHWLVLDVDYLSGVATAEDFVKKILPEEFHDVSYICHMSSSMGIDPDKPFACHIFFLLARPANPRTLGLWTQYLNLSTPALAKDLRLAKGNATLKWPLDIAVNRNTQIIYIADPQCREGVDDPYKGKRFSLVRKAKSKVNFNFAQQEPAVIKTMTKEQVNTLRTSLGLAKTKFATYTGKGAALPVLKEVDEASFYGEVFSERGFTYLPINPSNPNTYYHPDDNFEFTYSFAETEVCFPTKELAPDYYNAMKSATRAPAKSAPAQKRYWIFRNPDMKLALCSAEYDPLTTTTTIREVGSEKAAVDALIFRGQPVPTNYEEWTVHFDPTSLDALTDFNNRRINVFQPSAYLLEAEVSDYTDYCPTLIQRIIFHATGSCEETFHTFINWLAYIVQQRKKTKSAWILHGTTGTGKGLTCDAIITPLLGGSPYATQTTLASVADKFNAWRKEAIFVNVDETNINSTRDFAGLYDILKNAITENTAKLRAMRQEQVVCPVYDNYVFTSNEIAALNIPHDDRRFHIAPRQERKLEITREEAEQRIQEELQDFANYLRHVAVDETLLTPKRTLAKITLQEASEQTHERFCRAIREGDMLFLVEAIIDERNADNEVAYSRAIAALGAAYAQRRKGVGMTTNQQFAAIWTAYSGRATNTRKLGKMFAMAGLSKTSHRFGKEVHRGWKTDWDVSPAELTRFMTGVKGAQMEIVLNDQENEAHQLESV